MTKLTPEHKDAVGKPYDDALGERLKLAAGCVSLRVWRPGTKGTMDMRMNRLNVYVGTDGCVSRVKIG